MNPPVVKAFLATSVTGSVKRSLALWRAGLKVEELPAPDQDVAEPM